MPSSGFDTADHLGRGFWVARRTGDVPVRVKLRRTQSEHMFSALLPNSDMQAACLIGARSDITWHDAEKLFLLNFSQVLDDIQYSFLNNLLGVARHIQQ
jgi:hypothetical protein